jgi:ATP-dependent Clp protease ATP-binding subunit ClpC
MFRMEPNVVLKYFDPLDAFVPVRRFTAEEISRLLKSAHLADRRSYVGLVVNACVQGLDLRHLEHADALYDLCVEVNPGLDIHRVAIEAGGTSRSELHLLEQSPAAVPRDFRRLQDLEASLLRHVVGQDAAVASVSRAVRKAMTGLRDPRRPIAAFFFVGQTGVGKTELAKALTLHLFQDPARLMRVDGSEYALPHEYAKLIGAPPGYVGHDHPGLLAEVAHREGPITVLFDEIEKSDPKVHNLMLQIMDEGFLTDNKGARLSFADTILIFTSNVGAEEGEALKHRIGFRKQGPAREELLEEVSRCLKTSFRPEFVNRLTELVFFNPLTLDECVRIAERFLEEVGRHAAGVPLSLRFEEEVPRWLAERGFSPEYGARELRRTVEREVEGALSDLLVEGTLHEGDRVRIRVRKDRLVFSRN